MLCIWETQFVAKVRFSVPKAQNFSRDFKYQIFCHFSYGQLKSLGKITANLFNILEENVGKNTHSNSQFKKNLIYYKIIYNKIF